MNKRADGKPDVRFYFEYRSWGYPRYCVVCTADTLEEARAVFRKENPGMVETASGKYTHKQALRLQAIEMKVAADIRERMLRHVRAVRRLAAALTSECQAEEVNARARRLERAVERYVT